MKVPERRFPGDFDLVPDRSKAREIIVVWTIVVIAVVVGMGAKRPHQIWWVVGIAAPCLIVLGEGVRRVLRVSVSVRGDEVFVRNWWSTRVYARRDIRDFVIIEDRPVSALQDFLRKRSPSPVLTYLVLRDESTINCRAISGGVANDLEARVGRLQRWLANGSMRPSLSRRQVSRSRPSPRSRPAH